MGHDLQKASMWKRASAWLLDVILLATAAVGLMLLISWLTGYEGYSQTFAQRQELHAQTHLGMSMEQAGKLSVEQLEAMKEQVTAFENAVKNDQVALKAYNMTVSLSLVMITGGILLSYLLLEFAVPLLFGNGMTLGKKIFGLGVMKDTWVKINPVTLFIRTVLGKFTLETMIPVLMILLIFFGGLGMIGIIVIGGILLLQLGLLIFTQTNTTIHDLMAKTVVVDYVSQRIYDSEQEALEEKKRIAAEKAAQKDY